MTASFADAAAAVVVVIVEYSQTNYPIQIACGDAIVF